jgi:hypothetical protein
MAAGVPSRHDRRESVVTRPPMHRHPLVAVRIAACALALAACAPLHPSACSPGEQPSIHDLLYFGTTKPSGVVTADEWADFLRTTVTPRFPQGLTVLPASGQWRTPGGAIITEGTQVLSLIHPSDAATEKAVAEIIAAYKSRFQQESVLRVKADVCASF